MPEIQGGRGLAALAVLGYHELLFFPLVLPFAGFVLAGWSGVVFFFVLSGYLFTRLYYPKIKLGPHYLRRFFRTFPLYYLSIPLFVYVGIFKFSPLDLLYLQDYLPWTYQESPYWTLCIEELFYFLLLPILFWVLARVNRKALLAGSAALSLVWILAVPDGSWLVKQVPGYFVCYVLGAYIALEKPKVGKWAGLAILFVTLWGLPSNENWYTSPLVASVGWGGFLASVVDGNRILASAPFQFLGDISYGVYLFQVPLLLSFGPVIGVLGTLALSTGTHYLLEAPLIAQGRRLASKLG